MFCQRPIHVNQNVYSCRNCECCVVERANSLSHRIMNELGYLNSGQITYFVTLTYSNEYLPVVYEDDIKHDVAIIYRSNTGEVLEDVSSYSSCWYDSLNFSTSLSSKVFVLPDKDDFHWKTRSIGVIYFRDIQLFLKRLNRFFSRTHYGYSQFRFYVSAEYGESTYRPHFHFLFTTSIPAKIFKFAIASCWTYCDYGSLERHLRRKGRHWFEVAIKPAKYVSTYLCDGFNLPMFYKLPVWRQKKSHSKYYGFANPDFSIHQVYAHLREANLQYFREYYDKSGQYHGDFVQYPSYVIHRFFPKIKRYAWLSHDDFIYLCENISGSFTRYSAFSSSSVCLSRSQIDLECFYFNERIRLLFDLLKYTLDDIINLIYACYRMFQYSVILSISFFDYLLLYESVYKLSSSIKLKSLHDSDINFLSSFRYYTNIDNLVTRLDDSPALDFIFSDFLGVVMTSQVLKFISQYKHPETFKLLRQFYDNKNIKKVKPDTFTYYNILYG